MASKPATISEDKKWQVESDLRTLCEAKMIEKDPARMKACKEMAKSKMMDMAEVATEEAE